ncbi:hypothetical protein FHR20_001330 [Sphingomonas leidyi]|uniref:Lysozyme inhibitor LprI-like N-terminal domain-containing protein n=1 Tax=Sphingomonas leidyi TaxID=68569 RepID=A0A7X5UY31_9SPHN|nr:lysozyme inhibitor LprI family protein [Sphingomonas leidyi]NIJ64399.1 hypothetical protein [Sphingomonas leidyi]
MIRSAALVLLALFCLVRPAAAQGAMSQDPMVEASRAKDRADRREIDRRAAAGETPARIIAAKAAAGDYLGRCPDTAYVVNEDCRFSEALALWRAKGMASARVGRALVQCGQYSQVVFNFCSGALTIAVQHDLDAEIATIRAKLTAEDREEQRACDKNEGPCAIAGHHVEALDAFHTTWLAYVDARCLYETQYSMGGSGYGGFNAGCWLQLAAAHMEQLEKPLES